MLGWTKNNSEQPSFERNGRTRTPSVTWRNSVTQQMLNSYSYRRFLACINSQVTYRVGQKRDHIVLRPVNKSWRDVQYEVTLIYAKFGADLFNISRVTSRITKWRRFLVYPAVGLYTHSCSVLVDNSCHKTTRKTFSSVKKIKSTPDLQNFCIKILFL